MEMVAGFDTDMTPHPYPRKGLDHTYEWEEEEEDTPTDNKP